MTRPTALLVDDEPQLLVALRRALESAWPELEVIGEALDGEEALELAEARPPDVAFLDIQMPGLSGLEVARRLQGRCHVVFVTAHDRYAVEAFEGAAADYLLKPVGGERLALTVKRLRSRLAAAPPDLAALLDALAGRLRPAEGYLQWLKVEHRQDVVLVPVEEVQLFQASEKYTLALTREREWVIRTPLVELEGQLDPARFWRVHRDAIVRVAAIDRASRDERGRLVLRLHDLPSTVAVSRAHAHRFKQM
jgi:DNA-binding LytR/AlgR family response regulator